MSQKRTLMMMMAAQGTPIWAVKNLYIPKINLLKLAWTKRSAGQELFIFPTSAYVTGKKSKLSSEWFLLLLV